MKVNSLEFLEMTNASNIVGISIKILRKTQSGQTSHPILSFQLLAQYSELTSHHQWHNLYRCAFDGKCWLEITNWFELLLKKQMGTMKSRAITWGVNVVSLSWSLFVGLRIQFTKCNWSKYFNIATAKMKQISFPT